MPGRKRADAMTARDEELAEMERLLDAIESRLKSQLSRGDGAIDEARAAQPRRRARASSADEEVGARAVRRGQVAGPAGGRRRVRRWGEAARKAARREIADGEHRSPRSLKAVREAFPLSQRELAERTRLSRATIASLEAGKQRAHPATRRVIARVLGVEAGEIAWE